MRPFLIKYNEDKMLNFSKNIIVPKDISYTIKSLSNPKYGSLTKQADNIYIYKPDPKQLSSGKITMTLGLSRKGNPSFQIDDIETKVQKQTCSRQEDLFWYPEGTSVTDPVSAFLSDYKGSSGHDDILNNNTIQDSNSEIWYSNNEYQPNIVSELRGKFQVQAKKYRIALRGRQYCALFISLDEGKKDELAANITNPTNVADFVIDENHTSNFKDYEFKNNQWIYFKAVLSQPVVSDNKKPFLGLGLGEIKEDGTVTNIQKLNDAYPEEYQPDPIFIGKPVYPRTWTQARVKVNHEKGTLLDYFYEPWRGEPLKFNITNLFDDDDTNYIHTNDGQNHVSEEKPFMICVDLGKEIECNTMTFYGPLEAGNQYHPKAFKLFGGNELNGELHLITDVNDTKVVNKNVVVSFPLAKFRYYQLNITATHAHSKKFVAYRYLEFSTQIRGRLVSIDDDRITLYNSWRKDKKVCTFGSLYVGEGSKKNHAKAVFKFTGKGFAINARKLNEYGSFDVLVDGKKVSTVNLNGDDFSIRCVYQNEALEDKEHTVTIDSASKINLDSFLIPQNLDSVDESVDDLEPKKVFNDDDWADSGKKKKKSNVGMIVGIVIAVVAVIAIVGFVVVIVMKKRGDLGSSRTTQSSSLL